MRVKDEPCTATNICRTGGASVTINKTPTYNHTEITGKTVYYRSECSVDVPIAELGEGTHSFKAFIYPDVTDGIDIVTATTASTTVTLNNKDCPQQGDLGLSDLSSDHGACGGARARVKRVPKDLRAGSLSSTPPRINEAGYCPPDAKVSNK
ncbi:hypothetical protein PoB_007316700 [Plakobranchus ocellatus]|uniref:Uncharacterized protein n=1 Tax=Plakobranchus ocellatus TaxID=259542 RepID=A0AAV4DQV5_9GAST|nr:hypothetical protein PoB_007316700 [Plakobranchus ocellatus]